MKKGSIIISLFLITSIFADDLATYEVMFDRLKTKREGLKQDQIFSLKDPFNLVLNNKSLKKSEKELVRYKLTGVLSNKAKINGNWYFLNDQIEGYKIIEIKENKVTLKDRDEVLELKLNEGNKDVKITYK